MKASIFIIVGAVLAVALLAACGSFRAQVVINETPAPAPTAAPAPAVAPVIIVQPAPVIAPSPAPDYTPLILMTTLTMLVIVVAIAIVLTRRPRTTTTPYTPAAPAAPYIPELPPTSITNHYHVYIGIMPNETRGDALARLMRAGMRFEDASAALSAPRAHAELPAPRGW